MNEHLHFSVGSPHSSLANQEIDQGNASWEIMDETSQGYFRRLICPHRHLRLEDIWRSQCLPFRHLHGSSHCLDSGERSRSVVRLRDLGHRMPRRSDSHCLQEPTQIRRGLRCAVLLLNLSERSYLEVVSERHRFRRILPFQKLSQMVHNQVGIVVCLNEPIKLVEVVLEGEVKC